MPHSRRAHSNVACGAASGGTKCARRARLAWRRVRQHRRLLPRVRVRGAKRDRRRRRRRVGRRLGCRRVSWRQRGGCTRAWHLSARRRRSRLRVSPDCGAWGGARDWSLPKRRSAAPRRAPPVCACGRGSRDALLQTMRYQRTVSRAFGHAAVRGRVSRPARSFWRNLVCRGSFWF